MAQPNVSGFNQLKGKGPSKLRDMVDAAYKSGCTAVALYFSAHWCPPCKKFTPILAKLYKKINKPKKRLEIIFVSNDKTEGEYDQYFATMPWATLGWDQHALEDAAKVYQIKGIPNLTVVNFDGSVGKGASTKGVDDIIDEVANKLRSGRPTAQKEQQCLDGLMKKWGSQVQASKWVGQGMSLGGGNAKAVPGAVNLKAAQPPSVD
jgi:thiol-disulfide isomerase/thioredoxin